MIVLLYLSYPLILFRYLELSDGVWKVTGHKPHSMFLLKHTWHLSLWYQCCQDITASTYIFVNRISCNICTHVHYGDDITRGSIKETSDTLCVKECLELNKPPPPLHHSVDVVFFLTLLKRVNIWKWFFHWPFTHSTICHSDKLWKFQLSFTGRRTAKSFPVCSLSVQYRNPADFPQNLTQCHKKQCSLDTGAGCQSPLQWFYLHQLYYPLKMFMTMTKVLNVIFFFFFLNFNQLNIWK